MKDDGYMLAKNQRDELNKILERVLSCFRIQNHPAHGDRSFIRDGEAASTRDGDDTVSECAGDGFFQKISRGCIFFDDIHPPPGSEVEAWFCTPWAAPFQLYVIMFLS